MVSKSGTASRKAKRGGVQPGKMSPDGLNALVEASFDAFILLDTNLDLIAANPAGETLLGFSMKRTPAGKGPSLLDLLPAMSGTKLHDALLEVLESGRPFAGENVEVPTGRGDRCFNLKVVKIGDCLGFVACDVTEHKQSIQALRESEKRLEEYLENSPDAIYISDTKGTFLYGNRVAERITGYSREEMVGRSFLEVAILAPEYMPKALENIESNIAGRSTGPDEFELVRKDGTRVPVEISTFPMAKGDRIEVIGIAREITDRKRAREELQRSEEYHRALIENSLDPILVINRDGTIRYKSASILGVFGYGQMDDIGSDSFDFVHPEDMSGAAEEFQRLVESPNAVSHYQMRARHADGSWRTLEVVGQNLLDNPAVAGIVASFRDVTDRNTAQEGLRRSEERFRSVLDGSFDTVYRLSFETGRYDYVSPSCRQLVGYSPEEFIELGVEHASSLIHPDDSEKVSRAIIALMARGKKGARGSTVEYRIRHREKGYRWVTDNISVICDDANVPVAVVGNVRDTTERVEMQRALKDSEEHFRALIENSLEAIAIVNRDGLLTYESPSFERLLGYGSDEHLGKSPFEFIHEEDLPRIMDVFGRTSQGPGAVVQDELRVWHKDGSLRTVEIVGQNLLDNLAVNGIVANIRDITERRQAEEELRQIYRQERELRRQLEDEMKRRVDFTRALAHELKTPLTSVLASSDLLTAELRDEPLQTLARNIQQGAANLDTRIDELLDLARGEVGMLQLRLETVDLAELLRETAEAMSPLASRRGQSLVLSLPASLPNVRADAPRLRQVMNNLLGNAFKFTSVGGSVKLGARVKEGDVVVEVKDTGRGISKENQKLLFEPYRKAHDEPSGGLGLGLALSKALVELHGGQIWVKSSVGRGSTFGFSLPVEDGGEHVPRVDKPAKLWKVLIIEDDPQIVSFVSVAFEMRWPEADLITTSLGEEGLDLVEAETPDLVILDIGLPDMDGFDVLRQIRLFSSVPVVILTVEDDEVAMVRGLEWGADDYVVKPFRQLELLARLKIQLRKQGPADEEAPVVCGALRLDSSTFQLDYGSREIGLTLVEGRIMQYLMQNAGHVATHARLAEAVWGEDHPGALDSLRVYIRHLREKLEEDPSSPKLILTKVGVGYMLTKQV